MIVNTFDAFSLACAFGIYDCRMEILTSIFQQCSTLALRGETIGIVGSL